MGTLAGGVETGPIHGWLLSGKVTGWIAPDAGAEN